MTGYRMLSDEDLANFKAQGWEEVEIAELELYLLNNTINGARIQAREAWKEFFDVAFEPVRNKLTQLLRKIMK